MSYLPLIDVEDEGSVVNTATKLNFVGAGVTASDGGDGEATVTIPGVEVRNDAFFVNTATTLSFLGAGVTALDAGSGEATIIVPGGGSGVDVEEEGSAVNAATTINFVGAGVTAADAGGGEATVTIPGGSSGVDVEEEGSAVNAATTINFVGAGVTAADAGGGEATVTIPGNAPSAVTVVTAASPYAVTGSDEVIIINQTIAASLTVNLPAIGTTGRMLVITDGKGDAATNNITVDGNASETINGALTFVLNGDRWSLKIIDNGTEWSII